MAILSDTIINGNLSITDELNINGVKVATINDLEIIRQKIAKIVDRSIITITEKDLAGATSISSYAFFWCDSLTSITIPDSVTSIGSYALYNCTSLTSIVIPDGVTSIGNYALSWCSSLTNITIPDSVTNIGGSVFRYCRSLTDITFQGTQAQWNAIGKGVNWNSDTGLYTIHCTDGDIAKS